MQQQHNSWLENALNLYKSPVALIGQKDSILFTNAAFESTFPLCAKNSNLDILYSNNQDLETKIRQEMDPGDSVSFWESTIVLESGDPVVFDLDIIAVNEQKALFFHDRRSSVPIREHQIRADRLAAIATIASGLAHEIKNPLAGIKGACQLILQGELKENELKEYTSLILKETNRVDGLVEELLDLSKPRRFTPQVVDINQLVHDVLTLYRTTSPGDIHWVEELDLSLPEVHIDAERVKQVVLNLVKNACEAMEGRGALTVRTRFVMEFAIKKGTKRQNFFAVDIRDSGPGMDEATLAKIFVPFFTTKDFGTGMGLALSQHIIEDHGGNLTVKSKPGEGTTFSVILPTRM